jgi:anti-sigma-K factor RskA
MYDDDRDALAAEYVLGTLSADEREQAEALLAIDPGFAEIVRVWERRLGELNVMVEAVEPPAQVWDKIKTEITGPESATAAPRLVEEEEFSFPPIEETSARAAAAPAPSKPPEAVAAAAPVEPPPQAEEKPSEAEEHHELEEHRELEGHHELEEHRELDEHHELDEQRALDEQHAPQSPAPPTAVEDFEDLLAAPLPEAPEHPDEPSAAAASSLLPLEAESEEQTPEPASGPELLDEHDFEADLKAVVLQDLRRDGRDGRSRAAPEPVAPPTPPPSERSADIIVLARRARRWRRLTMAMTAIAALLALYVGISQFAPGLVPVSRPTPPAVTAQVAQPQSRLVAVLQQDPTTPAFLVSVDPASRALTVRRVAAVPEPNRSYELWLISNKFPAPRSLGLVGAGEFTARTLPSGFDADTLKAASYAISLEPSGGSPTGAPTGPILFKGRMVESLPGSAG